MTSMADVQRSSFEERLGRIQEGGPNTLGQTLIGVAEPEKVTKAQKKRMAKQARANRAQKKKTSFFSDVMMSPFAAAIGGISVLAGSMFGYHFLTPEGRFPIEDPNPYLVLTGDIGLAVILVLILGWAFKLLGAPLRRLALIAGMGAVMFGEHLIIDRYPDVFAQLYSEAYVASSQAQSSVATAGITAF